MKNIPYTSAVRILMYAQVWTRQGITYITRMLGCYLYNPGLEHWRVVKMVL